MAHKNKIRISILFVALAIGLAGCGSKRQDVRDLPPEVKIRQTADPVKLLQTLQDRNKTINSLRTSSGEFEYRRTNTREPYEGTSIRFAVKKPGKVYARASATAVGDIFYLHTNGERYWVEATRENKLFSGSVNENEIVSQTQSDDFWRNLTPSILFEALLIDNLDHYEHTSFAIEPDFYIIFLFERGGNSGLTLRRQIWIERENLTVERHRVFNRHGELTTEAFLYQYKSVDGISMPHYLRIERYWESISIKFTVEEFVLNSELSDELFEYDSPPAGFEIIDLDKREENAESGKSQPAS
jgi:outer membrane lipoprotein-sorting protein